MITNKSTFDVDNSFIFSYDLPFGKGEKRRKKMKENYNVKYKANGITKNTPTKGKANYIG